MDLTTMINRHFPPDEQHNSEQIIPSGSAYGGEPETTFWRREVERGSHRIYVTKIGPVGFLPFFLLGGIISIALLIVGRLFSFDSRGWLRPCCGHPRQFAAWKSALAALILNSW